MAGKVSSDVFGPLRSLVSRAEKDKMVKKSDEKKIKNEGARLQKQVLKTQSSIFMDALLQSEMRILGELGRVKKGSEEEKKLNEKLERNLELQRELKRAAKEEGFRLGSK